MIEDYKNWLITRQYSGNTVALYARRIDRFLSHHQDPHELTRQNIQDYLMSLNRSGMSYTTLNGHFAAIKNFFAYLTIAGRGSIQLDQNPLKYIMPLRRSKTVPRIIPDDEINAMLRQIKDLKTLRRCRDYAIMLFLLHGLRAEEICSLDMDDVYIDGRGVTRKMVVRVKGKGNKERIIVIETSGDTEWGWDRYIKMKNGIKTNIVFPALMGKGRVKRLTTNGLYRLIARYAAKAGVKYFNPHLWRHTAATRLLEKGVPLKEIQYRLGHVSIATTEKYLGAATILQDESAHCDWINNLKKPDAKYRRWR
jgi:site-specific recombinase XerD